eukprot:1708979-Prymnesium_polylepis.2
MLGIKKCIPTVPRPTTWKNAAWLTTSSAALRFEVMSWSESDLPFDCFCLCVLPLPARGVVFAFAA